VSLERLSWHSCDAHRGDFRSIGSRHAEIAAGSAGVFFGSVPFPVEDAQIPYFQIKRNGAKIKDGYGSVYVTNSCDFYNFNPFVGLIS
jgi:glucan endo-1,3-alpha-glucosidase